ncbi:MAG: FliM/FliN family flagellar motor switch protein [Phyllobacteriaceae bacterium]|nr:FliM/FliN family flagellar motor switch protein [Phyllobacteriaceae bacterium]
MSGGARLLASDLATPLTPLERRIAVMAVVRIVPPDSLPLLALNDVERDAAIGALAMWDIAAIALTDEGHKGPAMLLAAPVADAGIVPVAVPPAQLAKKLRARMGFASVPLDVVLRPAAVPLARLKAMQPGDVLALGLAKDCRLEARANGALALSGHLAAGTDGFSMIVGTTAPEGAMP